MEVGPETLTLSRGKVIHGVLLSDIQMKILQPTNQIKNKHY